MNNFELLKILVSILLFLFLYKQIFLLRNKKKIPNKEKRFNEDYVLLKKKIENAEFLINKYQKLISERTQFPEITKDEYLILIKRLHPDTSKNEKELLLLNKVTKFINENKPGK